MKLSWLPGILCVVLCLVLPQEGSSGAKNQHSADSDTEDVSASLISKVVQNKASSIQHNSTELNDMSAKSHHLMKQNETSRINHFLSRVKRRRNHRKKVSRRSAVPRNSDKIVPWGQFKKHKEYNRYYWGFPSSSEGFIKDIFNGRYNATYYVGPWAWKQPLIWTVFSMQEKFCMPIKLKPFDCIFKRLLKLKKHSYSIYRKLKHKSKFEDLFRFDMEQLVCIS